jgi:Arc/MetJ-type ribon-helix-helix transcriptional regulator
MSKMITVRTPEDRVAHIDRLVAAGVYESRASFIIAAIDRLVVELEREAVDCAFVEGYTRLPPTRQERAWAESSTVESIREEPW